MWDDLAAQVAVSLEQLERLLEVYRPLMERCEITAPDPIELAALASMLHAFYNGVENLFKRIDVESDEDLPTGGIRHRRLLDQMAASTRIRPAVIAADLHSRLPLHLDFRHAFRHSYTFDLRWANMRELVLHCDETLTRLRHSLDEFLSPARGE